MKILRITAQGLPLFKKDLDICFYTQQRVCEVFLCVCGIMEPRRWFL